MKKRKPTILSQQVENNQVTLVLKVDHDIQDFEGHFPSFPLLPGVTQLDWVLFYAKEILTLSLPFSGIDVIKFQEPILPNAIVTLTISWDSNKNKLQFTYFSVEKTLYSTGKIKLGYKEDHA